MGLNREIKNELAKIQRLEAQYVAESDKNTALRKLLDEKYDRIAELEAEVAALRAANEWHYLPELPDIEGEVQIAHEAHGVVTCFYAADWDQWILARNIAIDPPYAWRELPTIPPRP